MRPPINNPTSAPDVTDSPATLPVVRISEWLGLAERLDGHAAEWRAMADKNVKDGNRDSFQWCDGRAVSYKLAAEEVRKLASPNDALCDGGPQSVESK